MTIGNYGLEFTFTNETDGIVSANQLGIPGLAPGETVTIYENKLRPGHFGMVDGGKLSVSPELPPDLVTRAASLNWQDSEWRKLLEMLAASKDSLAFASDAPATADVDAEVEVELFLLDAAGVPILLDSEEEVDISVDTGLIVDVSGYVSGDLNDVGPIRAKCASGLITITVTDDAAEAQTISLANPSTAGLTVTDTHVVTYS